MADPISILGGGPFSSSTWSVNGHEYAVVLADGLSWEEASQAAAAMSGGTWHLATITSDAEQSFVSSLAMRGRELWLGGAQLGGSASPGSGWAWITGEALSYSNWARGEANDHYGAGSEQHLAMWVSTRTWNDEGKLGNISGFIAERPAPVPEPATLVLFGLGTAGSALLARRRRRAHDASLQ